MSELAIIDSDAFKRIEDVADLLLKGKSEYQIAREMGIKVVEAKTAIAQWKEIVSTDMDARDNAKDYLNKLVLHYDKLIEKSYDNLSNLHLLEFNSNVSAQINATLKNISEFEKVRVDLLQKSGLLDAHDLGDELAEREQREQMLIGILRNDLCDDCKVVVRDRLSILTGHVEGTVVSESP